MILEASYMCVDIYYIQGVNVMIDISLKRVNDSLNYIDVVFVYE